MSDQDSDELGAIGPLAPDPAAVQGDPLVKPELPALEPGELVLQPPRKNRLTVVEMVYHQPVGDSPTTAFEEGSRFSRELESDEQPYSRKRVAKEEWQPLDCGWIERCGMLLMRNLEGKFSVRPTQEQRDEVSRRVVELSFDGVHPRLLIPPGESLRVYPADAKDISVRCRQGTARYEVYLIPE